MLTPSFTKNIICSENGQRRFQLPLFWELLEYGAKKPLNAEGVAGSMRTVFSDESGLGDEIQEPILVVAAVIIDGDHQWRPIETAKDEILQAHVPEAKRPTFEFKASRLFGQLSKGNNEAILRQLLQIVATFQLPITWAAVDRAGMKNEYASQGLKCPKELMQDLAFSIAATQTEYLMRKMWSGERAIWLADETRANPKMTASLRMLQVKAPFDDEELTKFEHIIATIFFGSSRLSTGIQLADACNFFIKRHHMGDASADRFFKMIYPFMMNRDDRPMYGPTD
jgi:hypothetical protein